MPQELFEAVSHAGICVGAGRRLQLVNVRRLFDHVPVPVSLSYSLDHTGFSQASEERLNRDQLRKCITHGEKRVELVQAVASELESHREEMDRQLKEKTPDAIVLTFTSALMKAAKVVFGVVQGGRTAAQKTEAKQLAALLRQRRALRQRLHGCSEGMDFDTHNGDCASVEAAPSYGSRTGRATEAVSGRGAGEGVEAGSVVRRRKGRQASQLQRTRGKEASVRAPGVDPAYRVHASGQAEVAGQGREMCCCRDRNG